MPRAKRSPAGDDGRREDWLGHDAAARARPWALEEQLFGQMADPAQQRMIEAVEADLAKERFEFTRMEDELHLQAVRIAALEERLAALRPSRGEWPGEHATNEAPISFPSSGAHFERDYLLSRCEGFEVDSPGGRVGVVEGIRYLSRIDQPDVLEVRTGPFGRDLLIVPVEEVTEIKFDDGRLVLRTTPGEDADSDIGERHDYLHDLLDRVRGLRRPHDESLDETLGFGSVEEWPSASSQHET